MASHKIGAIHILLKSRRKSSAESSCFGFSRASPLEKKRPASRRERQAFKYPMKERSDFVVVVVDADQVGQAVIVVVFVFLEEGVVVIIVDLDFVIAQIRDVVAVRALVGLFQ